jgi:hypothetical protein
MDVDFSDLLMENRLYGEVVPEVAVRLQMSVMSTIHADKFRVADQPPQNFEES